jgi:ribosome-associated translation inhibitor RaiA
MRVNLSGHHVDVTPALRSYVERKRGRARRAATPRRAALVPAL